MSEYKKRYNPDRSAEWNYGGSKWKLSRSKIDLFVECPRCFYLDNKLGTKRPGMPSFNINIAVDELWKKEFDLYRKKQKPHPIMEQNNLQALPYEHASLDMWRDNFTGVMHTHKETGLVVSGAVDDIWINDKDELIVVDYKATSKPDPIHSLADSPWEAQYRRQIGVYQWLLRKNNFPVATTGYFLYANALQSAETFGNSLTFDITLLPCEGSDDWIDTTLLAIKACLDSDVYPESSTDCEYCAYRTACGKKLQHIHAAKNKK